MGLTVLRKSHLDHGLSKAQLAYILQQFAGATRFFKAEVVLPDHLGQAPLGIYGPIAGDPPVAECDVFYRSRGNRTTKSRMIDLPFRRTSTVSIIAGPDGLFDCRVYMIYGGFLAPREPDDESLDERDLAEAKAFWTQHALVPQERAA